MTCSIFRALLPHCNFRNEVYRKQWLAQPLGYVNKVLWTGSATVSDCKELSHTEMNYVDIWLKTTANRPAMQCKKNHALQQRRGAGAVPLSPSWQVCSVTWQLSISMINAVDLGLPVTKLKSVLLRYFKVKWLSRTTQTAKDNLYIISHIHSHVKSKRLEHQWCPHMAC